MILYEVTRTWSSCTLLSNQQNQRCVWHRLLSRAPAETRVVSIIYPSHSTCDLGQPSYSECKPIPSTAQGLPGETSPHSTGLLTGLPNALLHNPYGDALAATEKQELNFMANKDVSNCTNKQFPKGTKQKRTALRGNNKFSREAKMIIEETSV